MFGTPGSTADIIACAVAQLSLLAAVTGTRRERIVRGLSDSHLAGKAHLVMTEAFERVAAYVEEFRQSLDSCRQGDSFRSVDLKGAYGALGRLWARYEQEKESLASEERSVLRKVFEDDSFIKGMMHMRQISEHVIKRSGGGAVIRTTSNVPFEVPVVCSAMPMFAAPVVVVHDKSGAPQRVDHMELLEEAEKRVAAALAKADKPTTPEAGN